jgi:hypothetical protein
MRRGRAAGRELLCRRFLCLEHEAEKWMPVSRLREARFGGRRKVGKIMLQQKI